MQPADNRQNGRRRAAASRRLSHGRAGFNRPSTSVWWIGTAGCRAGWRGRSSSGGCFPGSRCASVLGILLFFQAEANPALVGAARWSGLVRAALQSRSGAGWRFWRYVSGSRWSSRGLPPGFFRTRIVEAPVLGRIVIATMTGFIETVEDRPDGKRLLVRVADLQGVGAATRPRLVRVTVRRGEGFVAGQFISARTRLLPPPQPAWPGGYDFATRRLLPRHRRGRLRSRARRRTLDPPAPAP